MLRGIPHRKILDLALIYYYRTEQIFCNSARILIRSEHMKNWKVTDEMLYEAAVKNTRRHLPFQFMSIGQVIAGLSDDEEIGNMADECRDDEGMYVLTNEEKYLGAVCVCYPGVLERIADTFGRSFFLCCRVVFMSVLLFLRPWRILRGSSGDCPGGEPLICVGGGVSVRQRLLLRQERKGSLAGEFYLCKTSDLKDFTIPCLYGTLVQCGMKYHGEHL